MNNPFIEVISQTLPEPQASLLAGMIFGVRSSLPKDLIEALITTGTIHIVALSGQNISILARIVSEVTLVFGRKISSLLTIIGIIGFVLFVGIAAPVVRAAIMGSLSLIAVYFGRKDWALLSLFLAGSFMLMINPEWLSSVSFQLSFLSTLGIILLASNQPGKIEGLVNELKHDLLLNLRITLAAQLFTLPVVFLTFHRISLIAPITNVLISFVITPIMVLGIMLSLIGWVFLPLGHLFGYLVWVPLTYLVTVVDITSRFPFASIRF